MMNNENGRSMVEMLGVLAIIGVLSVAGIAGYSMAMRKYRVNEVLNAASQLVVLAQAQAQGNGGTAETKDLTGDANYTVAGYKMKADCENLVNGKCVVSATSGDTTDTVWTEAQSQAATGGYFTLS